MNVYFGACIRAIHVKGPLEFILRIAFCCCTVAVAGCGASNPQIVSRASSQSFLPKAEATFRALANESDVVALVRQEFERRGFKLTDRHKSGEWNIPRSTQWYVFKGNRTQAMAAYANSYGGWAVSTPVGSVFYVQVKAVDNSVTLFLLGKPTIAGQELCSDEDVLLQELEYWCNDTKTTKNYPANKFTTGKEEAETIRGMLAALSLAFDDQSPEPSREAETTPGVSL